MTHLDCYIVMRCVSSIPKNYFHYKGNEPSPDSRIFLAPVIHLIKSISVGRVDIKNMNDLVYITANIPP
jgi:hypothetical protein